MITTLIVLGISFSSLYVFSSGLPQPADFILALACLAFLAKVIFIKKINIKNEVISPLLLIWCFVIYALCVAMYWSFYFQDYVFLQNWVFYLFNVLVSTVIVLKLNSSNSFARYIYYSLCFALILSAIGVLVSFGLSVRVTGFFNNPNQLAFYSLLVWACILVLTEAKFQSSIIYWSAFISAILGVFAAASLGAMAGMLLLIGVSFSRNLSINQIIKVIVFLVICMIILLTLATEYIITVIDNVFLRLDRAESKIADIMSERNYDRIIEFPQYIILGAGEGRLERFYPFHRHEIHSTLGNLIFSYGIPGAFILAYSWFCALRKQKFYVTLIFLSPIIYSMTHMGLRTTMFWMLFALICSNHKSKMK